ncbi:helix-turn-helix domain-containing protein [Roseiconus lacunae]|uniref:helix-turn-helix domain-containing protein n=1 Tax=Roseiconus lacunae TaxID=2605694 RepID=UPI003087D40B|nr:helix-turn-helix domain-containing protein [Stieleria sp. HD01]
MTPRQFGAQIRMRRLEQHLTTRELAEILWISNSHLESLERGEFEERDEKLIPTLDEIFDSSPWDQLAFDGYERLFPQSDPRREALLTGVIDPGRQKTPSILVQV